ncbi:MAG: DUF3368 domain-containing protein [Defluviitaleaceae bacterium]|nr:DUF3368 domain-containing protein [Defluviitaleaceae bacterium]
MDVVINASPLILLNKIGRLELLNNLFDTVYVPSAVLQEIQEADKPKVDLNLLDFQQLKVVNKVAVLGLLGRLHLGEVEVMVGAIERNVQTVVLDDNAARNKAKQLGLHVTGTLGILQGAYKKGFVNNLEKEITNLKSVGMYLSSEIVRKILSFSGK